MIHVQALVPAEHASKHLLVVPQGASDRLPALASSWFAEAGWIREPAPVAAPRRMAGARFRGMQSEPVADTGPARLALGAEHCADGPFAAAADQVSQLGLAGLTGLAGPAAPAEVWALGRADGMVDVRGPRPSTYDDRDGISRAFASALPQGGELQVVRWAVAVARKLGTAVLADGRHLLSPDPASAVDLALYSPQPVAATDLLALLRSLVATAHLESQELAPDGSDRYRLVAATPYDGAFVVQVERAERMPLALAGLEWREYGPFAYQLAWRPHEPYELQVEQPSGVHVIARARMRALLARLALLLHARIDGTLVDDGGFVATRSEVQERADGVAAAASRAWV